VGGWSTDAGAGCYAARRLGRRRLQFFEAWATQTCVTAPARRRRVARAAVRF